MPDFYQENADHVPEPSDQVGTLDTTGTAGVGHNDFSRFSPVFEIARKQELEAAQRALDPEDPDVSASLVVLPDDPEQRPVAVQRIADALDAADVAVETRYGTAEHFEKEDDAQHAEGAVATSAQEHEETSLAGPDPFFTDLTGTLDTSGTALAGHPSADDISTAAQAEKATQATATADSGDGEPKAKKKAAPAKKKAAPKKAAAPKS